MCTSARLVQADEASEWYGMSHRSSPVPAANIELAEGEMVYLEVTVDPAAHGLDGLGEVQRAVMVETAGGQTFQFLMTANVVL
jgi:hypothetical protein